MSIPSPSSTRLLSDPRLRCGWGCGPAIILVGLTNLASAVEPDDQEVVTTTTTTTTTTVGGSSTSSTTVSETHGREVDFDPSWELGKTGLSLDLSGVHLGGLTGLTALGKLEYHTGTSFDPFIDGGIGLSGGRYGVGVCWTIDQHEWFHSEGRHHRVSIHSSTAIAPKVVMVHRWNDDDDRLDAWYGKDTPRDRYLGFEVDVMIGGATISPGIYRSQDTGDTYGAVAYGFGF